MLDESVGLEQLEGGMTGAGIDHRTIVAGTAGGARVERDQADEAPDERVFANIRQAFHGFGTSGQSKPRAMTW